MNKILKLFTVSAAVLSMTACGNDWLDVKPSDGLDTEEAIINAQRLNAAYVGMYDGLQGTSNLSSYYGARMIYYGDVRADDMQARAQGLRTSGCYEMRYQVDDAPNMWNVPYGVIRRANRVIDAIDKKQITDASEAAIGKIYAEAKVVRALVHFDLVRVYGLPYNADKGASLGVPIMTELLGDDANPTRNTVAEVYAQVIKDLNEAINSGFMAKIATKGYINVWTAKSLLARVYLTMDNNEEALKAAEEVINSNTYTLWSNNEYATAWDKTTGAHVKEMIFELINFSNDDWTDRSGIAYLYHEKGYADAIVTKSLVNLIESDTNDVRNNILLPAISDPTLIKKYGNQKLFVNKYPADVTEEMRLNNIPVIRLSEMYLTAAEAAFKTGDMDKAAKHLSVIILRANPKAKEVKADEVTLQRIINERRKEFVGEGQRYFDALRNNETIVRYSDELNMGNHYSLIKESQKFDRTYFRAILPIPSSEVDANPEIKKQQNPGY